MLDNRLVTFLEVCKHQSYTKAAKALHITQPAVSQQIRHLEDTYGTRLIIYENKRFRLTEQGEKLQTMAAAMLADSERLREAMLGKQSLSHITFGATRTIGEFVMPEIIEEFLCAYPSVKLTMLVDNTSNLEEKLRKGEIMFALIEGEFDHNAYFYECLSSEPFIAVCAPENPLSDGRHTLKELLNQRIFLREEGSGTRKILESLLAEHGIKTSQFQSVCEIGNVNAIKELVGRDMGITFLYRQAACRELGEGHLKEIILEKMSVLREFNFIMLKRSLFREEYQNFIEYFKKERRP